MCSCSSLSTWYASNKKRKLKHTIYQVQFYSYFVLYKERKKQNMSGKKMQRNLENKKKKTTKVNIQMNWFR